MTYPIERIRSDFPILARQVNHCQLTYLDSAASAQKPDAVIDCESDYYRQGYATVHRGIHTLSSEATARMENVRKQVARFIHAALADEIVFVKGATEGINLVANSWGRYNLRPGDNIIITEMEHHANIVPWQMLAKEKQLSLRYIPLLPGGTLDVARLPVLIDERTRLFAVTQVSNVLGTRNPLPELIAQVRATSDALVLVDGAQGIIHQKVDVQALDCDFYVFSGHKLYGPTGIGILYAKKALLDAMPPWEGGGSMIRTVSLTEGTTFNDAPWRFEAGSPHTAGMMGLGAAIDYVEQVGLDNIQAYEHELMRYTIEALQQVPHLTLYGPYDRTGVIAFNLGQHHAYDVGSFLDQYGIAIRTGHHCSMPLMAYFQVASMCRASLAMYTDRYDIDRLVAGLVRVQRLLG
ncbi:cysteine sulfinate desulfinase [Sodalis-like endosymbiont of Proechinophthirus fluctus]|uniref:cysteine desulfurase SufS n=1 Tax=Sodalis-like endosymbiont of Proechinophthirus fluctus TaxID=1462730 RepID=UPI0007A90B8E|nr:cysteine desulfurase SufS [Sodalis-like endosymbiont of Proechinophthirus fluctus]KYP97482.1 cysteine sulfinate desulfinase [Sodalis-like endosymbiont of Proechinophthirus fluctus]